MLSFRRVTPALLLLAAACAGVPSLTDSGATAPAAAFVAPGRLHLRFATVAGEAWFVARWPSDREDLAYRVAQLDVGEQPALMADGQPQDARPAQLHSRAEWDALLGDLFASLVPPASDEATLVTVQGRDIVFHRDKTGEMRVYPHAGKPSALAVVRTVDEPEFAAQALARMPGLRGSDAPRLYATGDPGTGGSYVLFDPAARVSVLVAPTAAPERGGGTAAVGTSLNFAQSLLLQSHVFAPLMHPMASAGRLLSHMTQSVAAALPRPASPPGDIPPISGAAPMNAAAFEEQLDGLVSSRAYAGKLRLLIDGETFFPRLIQAVQDARASVDVRVYIFDRDDYALRIADLLKARSSQVRVRVLLDELGSIGGGGSQAPYPYHRGAAATPVSIVTYLQDGAAVEARAQPNPFLTSDHTKVIVVDGERAFVGGMNIGYQYRYLWHDLMVEAEGPIARRLAQDFDTAWVGVLPAIVPSDRRPPATEVAPPPVPFGIRPLYTQPGNPEILRAQLAAIRAARRSIWIQQAYVSDDAIVAALIAARRRGVDVRMILPTRGDSGFMNSANLIATRAFVRNGVRVYAYPGMTHVKAAVYDDWAVVGSANFDKLSLRVNGETNLGTSDPGFAAALRRDLFERDFARSREVTTPPRVGWTTYVSDFVADQL
ncbi:MAG TPA: phosphatidylserine/phosphatidylglycerophosphate/cardiolipin synthase family protein [Burkholderiales bacterium]|nr:phosphatidylserine/phosphatidylglycerophosphate/cardiolipin synthase family protein [Burkholderiales bacterium]